MAKKETGLMAVASEEKMAVLRADFPQEDSFQRAFFPRLGMVSQDKTEGKGKAMKVIAEAGTFFTEHQTEELDENGKKVWERKELGSEIEGIIIFQRKQLRHYDESTEQFTSSPVYDNDEEVLPLFCDKAEVDRGTPVELKKKYEYTDPSTGKLKSKLEDNRILYVLYEGEIYQLNLRGSSMYSYMAWARKVSPPTVLVRFSSEPMEKGTISWNKMTFVVVRPITEQEASTVIKHVTEIKDGIAQEKAFYANKQAALDAQPLNKEFDKAK